MILARALTARCIEENPACKPVRDVFRPQSTFFFMTQKIKRGQRVAVQAMVRIRRLLKVHAAKASAEGAALAPLQVAPIPNAYPLHQCLVDVFILGKQLVRDVEQYQNFLAR